MMNSVEHAKNTCQAKTANRKPCKRNIATGQRFCWQHASGLRAKFKSLTHNQTIVFLLTLGSVVLAIAALPGIKEYLSREGDPFSVKVLSTVVDTSRNPLAGMFWLRYSSSLGATLTPLGTGVFLSIHNRRNIPVKINEFSIELQAERKDWLKLHPVPLKAGVAFFAAHGLHHASALDFSDNALDTILTSRNLGPSEIVEGWTFLLPEYSYPCPPNGTRVRYRVTLFDSDSTKYVWTSDYDLVGQQEDPAVGYTAQAYLHVLPGRGQIDVVSSRIPIRFWDAPTNDPIWINPDEVQ